MVPAGGTDTADTVPELNFGHLKSEVSDNFQFSGVGGGGLSEPNSYPEIGDSSFTHNNPMNEFEYGLFFDISTQITN